MKKTLVTGPSGHLGANLVRALLEQGREVKVLVHHDDGPVRGLPVEICRGDIRNPESLRLAMRDVDIVHHLAAVISLTDDQDGLVSGINVTGTRNVVEACLACGVRRLIHYSSVHAFTKHPPERIVDETAELALRPDDFAYDRSKALGVLEVCKGIDKGLDAVLLHPVGVIGPCDYKPSFMGRGLLLMYHGGMPMIVEGGFEWVDARDVAEAAISAETRGKCGEKYILGGHWRTLMEVSRTVSRLMGSPTLSFACPGWMALACAPVFEIGARIFGITPLYTRVSVLTLMGHRYISHEKAKQDLGYRLRPFDETISDTFAWFEEQGLLRKKYPTMKSLQEACS